MVFFGILDVYLGFGVSVRLLFFVFLCVVMCIKDIEEICFCILFLVVFVFGRGVVFRILLIIIIFFLVCFNCCKMGLFCLVIFLKYGFFISRDLLVLWKFLGDFVVSLIVVREGRMWILIDLLRYLELVGLINVV